MGIVQTQSDLFKISYICETFEMFSLNLNAFLFPRVRKTKTQITIPILSLKMVKQAKPHVKR